MGQDAYLLAIDQGTTSTRAILFKADGTPTASASADLPQLYPKGGWVEHDPERILTDTIETMRAAMREAGIGPEAIAGIGITNQRETSVLWDRATGRPIHNAIVWQDRRTAPLCHRLRHDGHEPLIQARTGLLLDPYFSATKIAWMLDEVPGARAKAQAGDLCFGTIDSWLIYHLTGGARHVTDVTNAARTLLFDIDRQAWDDDLLSLFSVPRAILPDVLDCCAPFGMVHADILGREMPILGVAGDQQAATVGQVCFEPGMMKSTYGTGCFALVNTGTTRAQSSNRLLSTIAYRIGGETVYALEGSIFVAGAVVQWLRDQLGVIGQAADSAQVAASAMDDDQVFLVPAFVGLGAPYWDPDARGALVGLTRETSSAEIVRAALDAVAYQTRDLMEAIDADMGQADGYASRPLRVDGGMVANDWFLSRLADFTGRPVERPTVIETTALGAAWLAGLQAGLYDGLEELSARWQADRQFMPSMDRADADRRYGGWKDAVSRTLSVRE